MAAANHNIIVSRGETYSFTLTIDNTDITGDSFEAHIRRDGGKPLVASFDCEIQTTDPSGIITATLSRGETLKLDGNINYKWDLFRYENSSQTTTCLIYGDVRVENNITDASWQ